MNEYTEISFPGLGIQWNPDRILSLGSLSIHYYGLIIAFGMVLAVLYGWKRSRQFGIKQNDIVDGVLIVVPIALICARLYYCLFQWKAGGYAENPISILYIWEGGLAIYGGVIGAVAAIAVFCKVKKIKLAALLDLVFLGFLIGQSIGRWGNFFNREAFGEETNSFLKMGLMNAITGKVTYHHPTFLYESVWNLLGFVLLHFLSKRRKYDGQIALGYCAWYGLGRAIIEGLRTDSLYIGNTDLRVSQLLAALSCVVAVAVLLMMSFKTHNKANLYVNQVPAFDEEEEEDEEDEEAEETEKVEEAEAVEESETAE
ncbi:MAG: prolipoprotein diacylglyceryl transferase [Oscillospiraceae bacterium]|nr:prolipoprotein diacylglyceryl transferase [Oscillospiraceae bacterium]